MSNGNNYEIIEELGRGGMGVVYKAHDKTLNRIVALKVLPSQLGKEPEHVKRFRREAMAAAGLNHPNIVTVYSAGEQDGKYHIAMEFVDGQNFAELVRESGKLECRRAVEFIRQAADALDEAHSKGIIHRDIKPHNILIDTRNRIKVVDFGLARITHDNTDMTIEGARLGTPRYMSPEQCESLPLTYHTDIYSLGAVLYELLTGKRAFKAKNVLALMRKITNSPFPDPRDDNPKVDDALAAIVAKMVAKKIDERYQSAAELIEDLDAWLRDGSAPIASDKTISKQRVTPLIGEAQRPVSAVARRDGSGKDFIVHFVDTDRPWAEWLYARLMEEEFTLDWILWDTADDTTSLRKIIASIDPATCVIIVCSPAYLRTLQMEEHALPEGEKGWKETAAAAGVQILPVRVLNCSVDKVFADVSFVDMTELDHDEGKGVLVKEAKRRRGLLPDESDEEPREFDSSPVQHFPSVVGVTNIPVEPNIHFTGRDAIIEATTKTFGPRGGLVAWVQPDSSQAGYGLTELAVEWADRKKSGYNVRWWVRADSSFACLVDFLALGEHLNIPTTASATDIIAGIKNWLSSNSGWLLVFNRASRLEDIAPYLPRTARGHILVTSPNATWPQQVRTIAVGPLEQREAVEFLQRRTRRFKTEGAAELAATLAGGRTETPATIEGPASDLATMLGRIPIALELAGAFMAGTRTTIDDFVALFSEAHKAFGDGPDARKPAALAATCLSLVLNRLIDGSRDALELLKICAYLHGTDIRLAALTEKANVFPKNAARILAEPEKLKAAVTALIRFGLADEQSGVMRIHPLVQETLARWIESNPKSAANPLDKRMAAAMQHARFGRKDPFLSLAAVARFIEAGFAAAPKSAEENAARRAAVPHAVTVARHAQRTGAAPESCIAIWQRLGAYLTGLSAHAPASRAYENARAVAEKTFGENDRRLSAIYRELGRARQQLNNPESALASYQRALLIDRKQLGDAHEDVANTLGQMGMLSMQLGDFRNAKQFAAQALEIDQKLFGPNHVNVSRDRTSLGSISREANNPSEAREHFAEALRILEHVHGPDDPSLSQAVKNLAGILRRMDDLKSARELYERALEMDRARFGENHPDVAQDYNNVGFLFQQQGEIGEAKRCFGKALTIDRTIFGEKHVKVAINKNNLANIAREEGDLTTAKEYYKAAAKIFRDTYGMKHEHTRNTLQNLYNVRELLKQDNTGPKV